MANDITKAISENNIKNGTIIVGCPVTGNTTGLKNDVSVYTKPNIADIEAKYDDRFDDPSYYYGVGDSTIVGG